VRHLAESQFCPEANLLVLGGTGEDGENSIRCHFLVLFESWLIQEGRTAKRRIFVPAMSTLPLSRLGP
jgi:hypothetical protein